MHFVEAVTAGDQLAQHERRPALGHNLRGFGDRAKLSITLLVGDDVSILSGPFCGRPEAMS